MGSHRKAPLTGGPQDGRQSWTVKNEQRRSGDALTVTGYEVEPSDIEPPNATVTVMP